MNARIVRRVGAREGYDRWAESYEAADNPVVAMDARVALQALAPSPGERILDAGCGTGRHVRALANTGVHVTGADFSGGMLAVARRGAPGVPFVRADLQRALPFRSGTFDAVLCALVGEHLTALDVLFAELARVTRTAGRLVFTVYHPDMAAAGIEANFETDGVEYRLGAETHGIADYTEAAERAGWKEIDLTEIRGDAALAAATPSGAKYIDRPLLLILRARH